MSNEPPEGQWHEVDIPGLAEGFKAEAFFPKRDCRACGKEIRAEGHCMAQIDQDILRSVTGCSEECAIELAGMKMWDSEGLAFHAGYDAHII